jgi:hypothetical protein
MQTSIGREVVYVSYVSGVNKTSQTWTCVFVLRMNVL